jgi:hypothetical protein
MIDPKCLKDGHFFGHSNEGFILPCCWADYKKYELIPQLVQDKFNLSNVNSVDEILNSEEWIFFLKNIKDNPLSICKKYCSNNDN